MSKALDRGAQILLYSQSILNQNVCWLRKRVGCVQQWTKER